MSRPNEPTELVAGLAVQANNLAEAARDLKESYRFSRTLKVVVAVGFLMLAGLTVVALQNRSNGATTRQSVAATQESIATIRDCTTPGGDCYERSRRTTGEAVAQIVSAVNAHTDLVFVATIECSHRLHRSDAAFEQCLHAKGVQ